MVRGVEKPLLIIETKVIATMRRRTKRRFAIAPWLGIVDVVVEEVFEMCGGRRVSPQDVVSAFMQTVMTD